MPTCRRSLVELLAFKAEAYRSKKAEKTHSGTHITHTVHSAVCNHHLITTPSLPELKPSVVYCFCPSLWTYLGNIASLFFFLLWPSLYLSISLTQPLTIRVKEDKQSLSIDIWSSWTQFGTVQSFFNIFFLIREQEEEKWTDSRFVFRQWAQVHIRKSGILQNRLKTDKDRRVCKKSSVYI